MMADFRFVETHATLVEFADDILLLWTGESVDELVEVIDDDLQKVINYYSTKGLKVNYNKTKCMAIGRKDTKLLDERMGVFGIERVDKLEYLGVVLDNRINMKDQLNKVVNKLVHSLRAIRVIRNYLPINVVWQFYNAFMTLHLNYCSFLLIRLPAELIVRLQVLQNRGLKAAFGLDIRHSTKELFEKHAPEALSTVGIAYLSILTLTRKSLNNNDESLPTFELISEGRRKNQIKTTVRCKKDILKSDIVFLGPFLFNQLPDEIRTTKNVEQFKARTKRYLLGKRDLLLDNQILKTHKIS
jgi:hypothetical protein